MIEPRRARDQRGVPGHRPDRTRERFEPISVIERGMSDPTTEETFQGSDSANEPGPFCLHPRRDFVLALQGPGSANEPGPFSLRTPRGLRVYAFKPVKIDADLAG